MMLCSRGAVLLVAAIFAGAHSLSAQPPLPAPTPSRAFVGVGGGVTNNETGRPRALADDDPFYGTESLFMTWIDAGFFVTPRFAVGAEGVWLGTVDSAGGSTRNQLAQQHTESAIVITARAHVAQLPKWAVEIVGGGGPLFAHRVTTPRSPVGRRVLAEERTTTVAVMLGADLPVRVATHFAVVPTLRAYRLLRPERPQGFSRRSSFTQVTAGVGGRVLW